MHVVVKGSVEYLGPHHTVLQRITTADRWADYQRWGEGVGVVPRGRGSLEWSTLCSAGKRMPRRNMIKNGI